MEAPSILLDDVWVEYTVYGMPSRSLKKTVVNVLSGGRLAGDDNALHVQALKGLNLHLKDGDRVGLIGGNGAGKTTLLRVLAGSMRPARGRMRRVGTTSSLFDVSLGMNGEATGWDNITLRGLFMGLTPREIRARTDEIVDFSGLEPAQLSRPMRTYSSGMVLRLAFAVSTSVHPDILLMDEWIGVGDANFFEQAQRRLNNLVEKARILVVASHIDTFITKLCNKALYLDRGSIRAFGPVQETIAQYHREHNILPAVADARGNRANAPADVTTASTQKVSAVDSLARAAVAPLDADQALALELARERERTRRLQLELDELHAVTAALQSSTVWRLTKPLRMLGSRLSSLRRLVWMLQTHSAARDLRRSGLFDADWYMARYPDVAASGLKPVVHYLTIGAAEGRNPGPFFHTAFYCVTNPDIGTMNPLQHYVVIGRQEGRPAVPVPTDEVWDEDSHYPAVAFVSGESGTPSEDYRVRHPLDFLHNDGIAAERVSLDSLAPSSMRRLARAKVLVLFRTPWTAALGMLIELVHSRGTTVVYDVDDYVFDPLLGNSPHFDGLRQLEPDPERRQEWIRQQRMALERADLCILSTDYLAERVRELGKTALVLRNGLDYGMMEAAIHCRKDSADSRFRIGYASGTPTHQRDFAEVAPALVQILASRPQVVLTLVGHICLSDFPDLGAFSDRIEQRPAVPHYRLFEELVRFDINLAPLEGGNIFSAAKSELKFVHAAAVGVPTIASPTPPFRAAIKEGVTGLLAGNTEEWLAGLERLIDDPALCRSMGMAAHQSAMATYGPEAKKDATLRLFRGLMEKVSA